MFRLLLLQDKYYVVQNNEDTDVNLKRFAVAAVEQQEFGNRYSSEFTRPCFLGDACTKEGRGDQSRAQTSSPVQPITSCNLKGRNSASSDAERRIFISNNLGDFRRYADVAVGACTGA